MNNPSEQPAAQPICPNCGELFHHYHICQVGVSLPQESPPSAQGVDLERLKELYAKSNQDTWIPHRYDDHGKETWGLAALGGGNPFPVKDFESILLAIALRNTCPALLSLAQQSASAAEEVKAAKEESKQAYQRGLDASLETNHQLLKDAHFYRSESQAAMSVLASVSNQRDAAQAALAQREAEVGRLKSLLSELFSLVNEESPRLLDEDSGGDAALYMNIKDALSQPAASAGGETEEGGVIFAAHIREWAKDVIQKFKLHPMAELSPPWSHYKLALNDLLQFVDKKCPNASRDTK